MQPPELDRARIHVWTASLSVEGGAVENLSTHLSDEERARADRYRVADARRRFIVAHAFLRQLLSIYVRRDPASLVLAFGAYGKPCLANDSGITFNLSHAGDTVMVAVALQREVGVDIEATTQDVDMDGIARHAFSPAECEVLATLAPAVRQDAFFRTWVRKEAYIKARGEGLSYPTRSFSVSHVPADNDALLVDEHEARTPADWRVTEITAPDGFRAALAARGRDWSVVQMNASKISEPHRADEVSSATRTGDEL